jgi:hypothetical protein
MTRLALLALLLAGCGSSYAPELGTTEPADAGDVVDAASFDAAPVDPCAHPNCENGGRVTLADGTEVLCQCPKAGR